MDTPGNDEPMQSTGSDLDNLELDDTLAPDEGKTRGAVLVETVIVISILLLLLFGVAEFGMVVRSKHGLAEASRAGARAAAALPRDDGFDEAASNAVRAAVREALPPDSIESLTIYRADPNSGEPLSGTVDNCTQCFRYTWDETNSTWTDITTSGWAASTQWACGEFNETDYVGVYIEASHEFVTAFWTDDVDLTSTSIMRLEPVTGTSVCSPTTNPPPTAAPTGTPTTGPTGTPTPTPTTIPTATPWPSGVPSPTPTFTPTPTSTPTPTPTPTSTPTPNGTATPTPTPTATNTPTPTPEANSWDPDVTYYYSPWGTWTYVWYVEGEVPPTPSGCTYYGYWHGGSYHSGGYEIYCNAPYGATATPTPTPDNVFDYDYYYAGFGAHWYVWYVENDVPSQLPSGCTYYGYWHGGSYHSGGWEVRCTSQQ